MTFVPGIFGPKHVAALSGLRRSQSTHMTREMLKKAFLSRLSFVGRSQFWTEDRRLTHIARNCRGTGFASTFAGEK